MYKRTGLPHSLPERPALLPGGPSSYTTSYKPLWFGTSFLITYLLSLINSRISCSNFSSIILSLSGKGKDTVNHSCLCLVPPSLQPRKATNPWSKQPCQPGFTRRPQE